VVASSEFGHFFAISDKWIFVHSYCPPVVVSVDNSSLFTRILKALDEIVSRFSGVPLVNIEICSIKGTRFGIERNESNSANGSDVLAIERIHNMVGCETGLDGADEKALNNGRHFLIRFKTLMNNFII
jgi:hypothetical protein